MKSLLNKVAIVTGASSGIGRATAILLAGEGARLVVSARHRAELDTLVDDIERTGGQARAVADDVGLGEWHEVMDNNLTSVFLGAKHQVQAFGEGLHALKRMATPQEIAQAVPFLASGASSFVTGTAFLVDGGVSINRT